MSDRIYASVDSVEASRLCPPSNGIVTEAGFAELRYRHDAVLPLREPRHPMIACVGFPAHMTDKPTQARVLPLRLGSPAWIRV
jgi:hypothetical protein